MTIKELFAPSDMTVGKPWEKIVIFTIPMLIGNIAQQLYNTVDSIVIGKLRGRQRPGGSRKRQPDPEPASGTFYRNLRRCRRYGISVFWCKTAGRAVHDDR